MARRLTEVFKTDDGKFFESLAEAEAHENMARMMQAIRQASKDACYDEFGRTSSGLWDYRLAEELTRHGFVYGGRK